MQLIFYVHTNAALCCLRQLSKTKFLFAGRLQPEKGVELLLSVIDVLDKKGIKIQVDIIGLGELREKCEQYAIQERNNVEYNLLDPVPYGKQFFELVMGYHCILVPSTSDEQPRIVFDAYSQGVPVIASDTDGLRPHVTEDTGWLVKPGNLSAWVNTVINASENSEALERRGLKSYELAGSSTHREMHRKRSSVLAKF